MPSGVITLGQVAARLATLDVACNRCDRRGRLHSGPLVQRHGPGLPMPELRQIVAADCPRMVEELVHAPCGVHFPQLATVVW